MPFDPIVTAEAEHLLRMAAAGPGWRDYARRKAAMLVANWPTWYGAHPDIAALAAELKPKEVPRGRNRN